MKFSQIRGNEAAVQAMRSMISSGRVPHALLLYENPRSGGLAIANAFLQRLFCSNPAGSEACGQCPSCRQIEHLSHPDVHYVFPVNTGGVIKDDHPVSEMALGTFRELFRQNPCFTEQELYEALDIESKAGNISVFEAKNIVSKLSLSSLAGGYKAVVMFLPERMNAQCANKLLKILEEPPAMTIFILVTQNPQDVMGTIFSRCQGMRILPFDRSQTVLQTPSQETLSLWRNLLEAIMRKDLAAALDSSDAITALSSRERQKDLCACATEELRKIMLYGRGLADICYASPDQEEYYREAAARCSAGFCSRAVAALDKAAALLGRNVSPKMVFTDLVNRLYVNLR